LTGREKIWYNEYEKYYNADLGRFTQEDPMRDGRTYYVQIGLSNKTGIPNTFEGAVIRERIAYSDLVNFGHIRPSNIFYLTYKN
jgi:hypothetical protein